ncbi:hypothetical protein [Paludibacterium yongneupense]|uniref:hypothetical protein n=1 Tax=Paludibacterium yongneupense TaxID=400061 RepID=UPI0004124759|nr:hypothetical protein [Paludibacterium yongneupense]
MSKFEYKGIAVRCAATEQEDGLFNGAAFVYLRGPDDSPHYMPNAVRGAESAASATEGAFAAARSYIDSHLPRRRKIH